MHSSNKFPSMEGWRRNADGVVKYTTYAQHGLVNIAKKKRELKSFQNQLFEEIFYHEIIFQPLFTPHSVILRYKGGVHLFLVTLRLDRIVQVKPSS